MTMFKWIVDKLFPLANDKHQSCLRARLSDEEKVELVVQVGNLLTVQAVRIEDETRRYLYEDGSVSHATMQKILDNMQDTHDVAVQSAVSSLSLLLEDESMDGGDILRRTAIARLEREHAARIEEAKRRYEEVQSAIDFVKGTIEKKDER